MKKAFFMLIVMVLVAAASFVFYSTTTIEPTPDLDEVRKKIEGQHPMKLSPEKTLEVYISAFIARDVDTVMSYHQGSSDHKEKMKQSWLDLMTDKKHIKRIVAIKRLKEWKSKGSRTVKLSAEYVATLFFKGSDALSFILGKRSIKRTWQLIQTRRNGPWYFNSGEF